MLDLEKPEIALMQAAHVLGLPIANTTSIESFWPRAIEMWRMQHGR